MAVYQSFPYNPSLHCASPLKSQAIHSSEFIKWSIHQSSSVSNFCAIATVSTCAKIVIG